MKSRNILIVGGVTLGILVVLEMVARIVLSRVYDRKFDSALIEPHKYGATDGLKANASGTVWGKTFHTDEMGGRKHTRDKKGKRKILVIGDSVTEGVGVEDSATFCNRFNNDIVFEDADVRNISMIGWSTADYRNVIDHLVGNDTSISDIFVFYCLNDIYGKTATSSLPVMAKDNIAGKINEFLQDKYATYKLLKLFLYQNSDRYFQYDQALYLDSNRVKNVVADFSHMRDTCADHLIRFNVTIVPYKSQLADRSRQIPDSILVNGLRQRYVRISVDDLLIILPHKLDYKDLYLFGDEIHLSEKGHSLIGSMFDEKE